MRKLMLLICLLALPVLASAQLLPSFAAPREGVDYEVLPTPQPTYGKGKIEVAEVFSYGCIHCAHFQPLVNAWKKTMPADVRWEYVPAAFGGPLDEFARAYFAAQALGVQPRTHDAVFKAVFEGKQVKSATTAEIADMYASFGVNRAKFLASRGSAAVTAKLKGAKQFALRTGIDGTPTIVVNGKYRVKGNTSSGLEGIFKTVDFLIQRERDSASKQASKT